MMRKLITKFSKERELWLISFFLLVWVAIFSYYPMYGIIISFNRYVPGRSFIAGKWVGLEYFVRFVTSSEFIYVLRNTLAISGLNILFGFPAPIILAILLNEMKLKFYKRFVQTVSYLPHFVSWVVTAGLLFILLGYDSSFNRLLVSLKIISEPVNWLSEGKYFWSILVFANIWKGVGWSSIIYLSAIAGIDDELYQAGAVDGLGRFGAIWHITFPGISTTIILLLILSIGGIFNAGFEQQLLLGTDSTREYYEVIDTYAYKYGIQLGRYSYGAAVGLMKGVIAVALVFFSNWLSQKYLDKSLL